jgi:ABC-2 type transport system ATP-binding protein
MRSATDLAIETRGLTRVFGALRAIDTLDLAIPRGSIFGLLGPNGSGKTTTIRMLLGILESTSGSARVLGFDTRSHAQDIRTRCGALLEHDGLYERLNAWNNLELFARIWGMRRDERQSRVEELLDRVGLLDRRNELVAAWSRGQKQKLAIARTLLHRPELLFLDEPSAGLDPVAARTFRRELARLVEQEQTTVFLTTHNLSEAERLCGRIGVLVEGRLAACGTPSEIAGSASVEDAVTALMEVS